MIQIKLQVHRDHLRSPSVMAALILAGWIAADLTALRAATISWDGGGGNTSWHTPANWSGDVLPGTADDVEINVPGDLTVVHASGTTQVRSLRAENGFQLAGGNLTLTAGLSFTHGVFKLTAGTFTVRGAGTSFSATGTVTNETADIAARLGGVLSLPTVQRLIRTTAGNWNITAGDAGSIVDLPNLQEASVASFYQWELEAFDGGRINAPALAQVNAFSFYADGTGSTVDLPGMQGLLRNTTPGTAYIEARNRGAVLIPNVTGFDRVSLYLRTGGQVPTAQLGSLTGAELVLDAVTNSFPVLTNVIGNHLTVSRAGRLILPGVTTLGRTNAGPLDLIASDPNSYLELPNVTHAVMEPFYRLEISAYAGGRISLPRLETLEGGIGAFADANGSIVDLPGLHGHITNPKAGSAYLEARNGGAVLIPNVTGLNRIDVYLRGTGNIPLAQLVSFTSADFELHGATLSLPGLIDVESSNFTVGVGGRLTLGGVTALNRPVTGDLIMTVREGATLDLPNVTSVHTVNFYQLELYTTSGGHILLPKLSQVDGALNAFAEHNGSQISLVGLTGRLDNMSLGSSYLEARSGATILIPNLTQLDRVNVTIRGTGQINTAQLISLTQAQLSLDGATGNFPALFDITDTGLALTTGAQLALPQVTQLIRTGPGNLNVSVNGAGSVLNLPNVVAATVQPFYQLELFATDGGHILLPQLATKIGAIDVFADDPNSLIDLSGLQGILTVQTSSQSFFVGAGATILIPNVTGLDKTSLTIVDTGQIATGQLTSLTSCDVTINDAVIAFLALTDITGTTFEYLNGGDAVFQPQSDLTVTGVFSPATAIASQPVQVIWELSNIGTSLTNGSWLDGVLLSADTLPGNDIFIGSASAAGDFATGTTRRFTNTVIFPADRAGTWRVAVAANYSRTVFEGTTYQNNTNVSAATLQIQAPDLMVETLNLASGTARLGDALGVTWTVRNTGAAPTTGPWADRLVLATNANALGHTQTLLTRPANEVLAPNGTYTRAESVVLPLLPNWPAGNYFIVALADAAHAVAESKETNNTKSASLSVTLPPLPDLAIAQITVPASALPGQTLNVTWAVTNRGTATAAGVWAESLFIASTIPASPLLPLATFNFTNNLPPASFLNRTQQVTLPANLSAETSRFFVETDSEQVIAESAENNNLGSSGQTVSVAAALTLQLAETHAAENATPPSIAALVTRNGTTTAPLVVTLISADPSELTAPATVTINAGQSSVAFTLGLVADGVFDADQPVTLTASASGYVADAATVTVLNADAPQLALQIGMPVVDEGGAVGVIVSHNGPTAAAVPVSVVALGTDQLAVPPIVSIPAGSASANFEIQAVDDTKLEAQRTATFQVSAPGFVSATSGVQIRDNDLPLFTLSLAASSVSEGAGIEATTATISRGTASPRSLTVALQNTNAAAAHVPASVVIPSGQASVSFPIAAVNDDQVDGPQTTQLRAVALASISGEPIAMSAPVTLTVTDDDGPALKVTLAKELVAEGLPAATTMTISRNTTTIQQIQVNLSSSNPSEATPPPTAILVAGQTSVSVAVTTPNDFVSDGTKSVVLTAAAAGFISGSATLVVSDVNQPDLVVTELAGPLSGETEGFMNVSYRVLNQGLASAGTNWTTRLFLSSDPLVGDDTLLADHTFNGTLPVGQFFGQSRQIRLPQAPGDYWIIATTDLAGQIDEILENNNTSISAQPVHVSAAYQATVQTAVTSAPAGTPVTLTGNATRTGTGGPASFALVNIHLTVRGTKRIFSAITDDSGNFTIVFTPLPGEAGFYEIGAAHPGAASAPIQDSFTLFGMKAETVASLKTTEHSSVTGQISFQNLGDIPLTGLTVDVLSHPPNVGVTASLGKTGPLPGLAANSVSYVLTVGDAAVAQGDITFRVTSAEGAVLNITLPITIESLRPRLVVNPTELVAGMKVGGQALVQFDVVNAGGAASASVHVALPDLPWLHVSSPNPMPPLAPGASNRVTLQLTPAANLALGAYDGWLGVNAGDIGTTVPFSFRALSEAKGDLRITAVDEFTYYAQGAPKVAGAAVTVRDAVTGETVATGVTDMNGLFLANQLEEGYYDVEVKAEKHANYRDLNLVGAGKVNDVLAFLRRETVRYIWSVVPTEIEDRTRITIETIFEAFVPMPVVTVDPPLIDLADFKADITQIDLKISNHGLVAAKEATLNFSTHPDWSFEPLIHELGDLPARSSLTIPLLIRRTGGGGSGASLIASLNGSGGGSGGGGGACSAGGNCQFVLECGGTKLPGSADVAMINASASGGCGGGGGGGVIPSGRTSGIPGGSSGGGGRPPSSSATIKSCDKCLLALFNCSFNLALPEIGSCFNDLGGCMRSFGQLNADQAAYSCMKAMFNCAGAVGKTTMGKAGKAFDIIECVLLVPAACDVFGGGSGSGGGGGSVSTLEAKLAGPTVHAASLGPVSRVERAEVLLLRERAEWLLDYFAPLRYFMGNDIWFRNGEPEVTATWMRAFTATIELETDAGALVSEDEMAQLLTVPLPQAVTAAHAQAFVERWNRSLEYWVAGITRQSQVPVGQNPDFIALDTTQALADAADLAIAKSAAQGYDSPEEAYNGMHADLLHFLSEGGGGGVCAQVRLRLEQEAVMTRDAFAASLEIENASAGPLQNISVEITARRRTGEDATELFGIRPPVLAGITAVDGTGVIGLAATGKATWTLVPTTDAVLGDSEEFLIGGLLRYHQEGLELTVPLAPASITVFPSASLAVKYFHQRDVFADDPFTTEVEPSVPYSLAVMVQNKGRGAARNVHINSAQPQIVENEKGLFADFKVIATEVAGQNLSPSLTVDFGQINPGTNAIGRWLLTSTILGGFIDYSATFEHLDGIGNKKMSLIEGVEIHELIHIVRAPEVLDDGRPDFLVNDVADLYDRPDTVHLSDGSVAPVSLVTEAAFDHAPESGDLVVQMSSSLPAGWAYLRVPDPGAGQYRLMHVVRSDGVEVPLGDNVWTTDRTFLGNARRPLRENILHLFDRNSTGGYILFYASLPPGDITPPTSAVTSLASDSTARIPVNWSGQDNPGGSGISFFDVFVSTDGGPFLQWQFETIDRSGVFQGGFGRTYAFYSVATDLAGNQEATPAVPDAQTTVTRTNHPPVLAPLADAVIREGETLSVQPIVSDEDGDDLIFSLGPDTPTGITIHPYTGLISWVTGEGSGPVQHLLTVQVLDNGSPRLGAVRTLLVTVSDDNAPPVLASIANRTINEGRLLIITNSASDFDLPAQHLTFVLGPGAPAGATVDAVTGVFQWRPTELQGGTTNRITITVRDDGLPNLSASQSFAIVVRDTPRDFAMRVGTTNVFAGQTTTVPLGLTAAADVERVAFNLNTTDAHWESLALAPTSPEVTSVSFEPVDGDTFRVQLDFDLDLTQPGTRTVAQLVVETQLAGSSSVAHLRVEGLEGLRGGELLGNAPTSNGRVFIVEHEPLADIGPATSGNLKLVLYGFPGVIYHLQSAEDPGAEDADWREEATVQLTGSSHEFTWPVSGEDLRFFRVVEGP